MKKIFISAIMAASAFAVSAQSYLINDNFASRTAESGYVNTSVTLQGSANIELTRNQCNFEAIDWSTATSESTDGQVSGGGFAIRIGDMDKSGYAEFTLPEGMSVGTVRLHFRGKGKITTNNRVAIVSINGIPEPEYTGLDSDTYGIFTKTYDEALTSDVTIRIYAGTPDGVEKDPILLNSIQVTEYEGGTSSLNNTSAEDAKVIACYDIMGNKLNSEPEQGFYIAVYSDGSSRKVIRK